jgi:hypothetical protein
MAKARNGPRCLNLMMMMMMMMMMKPLVRLIHKHLQFVAESCSNKRTNIEYEN